MQTLPDWFVREPAPGRGPPVLEVAAMWGDWLLDVRHLPADASLSIGVGGLPGPLDEVLLDHGELVLPPGCTALAYLEGAWGPWTGGIPAPGGRYVVRMAGFAWLVRLVPPGSRLPAAHLPQRDHGLLAAISIHAFLALMLWIVAVTSPPAPQVTVEELSEHFVEVLLRDPEPKKEIAAVNKLREPEEKIEGARAKRREGKRGSQDGRLKRAMEQRRNDRQVAEGAGFMSVFLEDAAFGERFSATGLGGGVIDALGRSEGPKGKQFGTGLAWDGDGPGGGGPAEGLPGGTGTTGRGGDGSSLDGGGPVGKKKTGSIARGGEVIHVGGMDAALIDQVVKQHLNQYRYCYQRQLQLNPDLGGKVTLKWIIATDGSVSSASVKRDEIGNAAINRCMTNVARRMRFPPPDRGIVIVSYPFLFSSG